MHRYFKWAIGAVAIVSMVACHKEDEEVKEKFADLTIYAAVSGEAVTDYDGSTACTFQLASEDSLKVILGKFSNALYCYSAGDGQNASLTTTSTGSYTVPDSYSNFYKAVYPYGATSSASADSLVTTVVTKQVASESLTKDMMRMIGISDSQNIKLYNALSYLRFTVDMEDVMSVSFYANSSDEKLTGSAAFKFDNGIPAVTYAGKAENSVTATAPTGFFVPGKAYYVSVLPASVKASGYTVIIQTKNGCYQKSVSASLVFARNKVTDIPVSTSDAHYFKSGAAVSVSTAKTMFFATGNLFFDSKSNSWRIASRQYDVASDGSDLFAWPSTGGENDSFKDWGANTILSADGKTSYGPGTWTTPSAEDFRYVVNSRKASKVGKTEDARYIKATVCGVPGLMIFPDIFEWPSELDVPSKINTYDADFAINSYSEAQFALLEEEGVTFLPAAGYKNAGVSAGVNSQGFYWTSTSGSISTSATSLSFSINTLALNSLARTQYYSVRLIRGWFE